VLAAADTSGSRRLPLLLSGARVSEFTIATTSHVIRRNARAVELLQRFGLPKIFPEIAGSRLTTAPSIAARPGSAGST
jgi:sugar (pentulose or hexulose) kinase